MTSQKLRSIFYSPEGYWKGEQAVDKLYEKTGLDKKDIRNWLRKQAVWQIYLPGPNQEVPRRTMMNTESVSPNFAHQLDVLYLPWDTVGRKKYKYALTVVDVGSRYKEAEPLVTKSADAVTEAIKKIYARSPLKVPDQIFVDSGSEFKGAFKKWIESKSVKIFVGTPGVHRSQGIVERFNRTLAERLFGYQYAQEMLNPDSRNTEWVVRLPKVIEALNKENTRLIDMKPVDAIKEEKVHQTPSAPIKNTEPIPSDAWVRHLFYPGELEGGNVRRATDPIWSTSVFTIKKRTSQFKKVKGKKVTTGPTLYFLEGGPDRSFVREELQVVPKDTELPKSN